MEQRELGALATGMKRLRCAGILALGILATTSVAEAQNRDVVITGGWLFTSTASERVRNPGLLIRAGKLLRVDGDLAIASPDAQQVQLADSETVIPGLFDLHAHYAISVYGVTAGRRDEMVAYPALFIANGVTSTFPAGEMDPAAMRALRLAIENGSIIGPRLMNSGPYFGSARPGWNRSMTREEIHAEVDHWAERGARGFKAKGISAAQLRALIERAHAHGLTVTGHLDAGGRGSVNPRDAILMGIDRVEHFMGGDAFTPDRSAYASYEHMRFDTPEFSRIADLYQQTHTYFDATMSAYGYYGADDPDVFKPFVDETRFWTPYLRSIVAARPPVAPMAQFTNIYWNKRKELNAFYDAGGADLITVGTDIPLATVALTPFSIHRELLAMSRAGIPNAAVLRMATVNAAHAMGVGDRLGTIEAGKWADLVIVRGDPTRDIRAARLPRLVIKGGVVYDPDALMRFAEGKIGPATAADSASWSPSAR